MVSFRKLLYFVTLAVGAAAVLDDDVTLEDIKRDLERRNLEARQGGGFTTQYWANEFADLDWTSGAAGRYSVDWNQGFGGNCESFFYLKTATN
jgi:hypothetical protein